MKEEHRIGKTGEDIACLFLIKSGFKVISRNYRKPWGEIDIIAISPEKILCFIEVKTMIANNLLIPEDNLTKAKLTRLNRICSQVANSPDFETYENWRLDLVAITIPKEADITNLTKLYKYCIIKHYTNV